SMASLKAALNSTRYVILTSQKDPEIENPEIDELYSVGVMARVIDVSPMDQEPVQAYVEVTERVRISEITLTEPYTEAKYELLESIVDEDSAEIEALARNVKERFQEVVFIGKTVPLELTFGILKE